MPDKVSQWAMGIIIGILFLLSTGAYGVTYMMHVSNRNYVEKITAEMRDYVERLAKENREYIEKVRDEKYVEYNEFTKAIGKLTTTVTIMDKNMERIEIFIEGLVVE